MTLLDEICDVLKRANEPLHFSDIARRLATRMNTNDPAKYVDGFICRHIRENPSSARIRRVEPGVFELANAPTQLAHPPIQIDIAYRRMARTQRRQWTGRATPPRESRKKKRKQTTSSNTQTIPPQPASRTYEEIAYHVLSVAADRFPMTIQEIAKYARQHHWVKKYRAVTNFTLAIHKEVSGSADKSSRFVYAGNNTIALREWYAEAGNTREYDISPTTP